ncbi:hypothetical protein Hanom_Chr04g00366361 [Helianthus anomalus]
MSAWPERPTPDLKLMPQGPRRNPCPPGMVTWAFYPYPRPNSRPIPRSLREEALKPRVRNVTLTWHDKAQP